MCQGLMMTRRKVPGESRQLRNDTSYAIDGETLSYRRIMNAKLIHSYIIQMYICTCAFVPPT